MAIVPTRESGAFRTRGEEDRDQSAVTAFRNIAKRKTAAREGASMSTQSDPDAAARANGMSKFLGVPPEFIERDLPRYDQQARTREIQAAMDRSPSVRRHMSEPRRAAVSHDDIGPLERLSKWFDDYRAGNREDLARSRAAQRSTRLRIAERDAAATNRSAENASGIFDRLGAFFQQGARSFESGIYSAGAAAKEFEADNGGFLSTSAEESRAQAANLRERARVTRELSPVRGQTTWEDVKGKEYGNPLAPLKFVAEQTAASLVPMGAAALNPGALALSQSGSIGQQRAENDGRQAAEIGDVLFAAPWATASVFLERLGIKGIFGASARTAAGRVGQAAATEAGTEFVQSSLEYSGGAVGTTEGFDWRDMLDQGAAGAFAGAGMGAAFRGSGEVANEVAKSVTSTIQARVGEMTLANIIADAASSKVREREPRLFEQYLENVSEGTPLENLFIPAEKIRELYQSNDWEMGVDEDGHLSALADDFWKQVDAGIASGGDVVVPMSRAVTMFAGTPEWEDIKGSVRVTPGGISPDEAAALEDNMLAQAETIGKAVSERASQAAIEGAPREKVFSSILSQARQAGFSLNASRSYAELWADRYQARAERLGGEVDAFTLFEQSFAGINPAQTQGAQAYREGDNLDVLINAIRTDAAPMAPRARSLVEEIMQGGGVIDDGGDIRSMGGDQVVTGGIFGRRRQSLIRERDDTGDMLGGDANADYGLDEWAQRLWEMGYFHHANERPSTNDLLDLIGQELGGEKVYPLDATMDPVVEANNALVTAAEDLRTLLEERGLDPRTASREEIEAAINAFESEDPVRSLDQSPVQFTSEGQPLVTVHNLSVDNFLNAEELGGLAAPSIAVIRADIPWNNFGEISLIAKPDLIDPARKSGKASAFNADVYSPRQPRAQFDLYKPVMDKLRGDMREAAADLEESVDVHFDPDKLAREGLSAIADSNIAKLTFLRSIGQDIRIPRDEPVTVDKRIAKAARGANSWQDLMFGNPAFEAAVVDVERERIDALAAVDQREQPLDMERIRLRTFDFDDAGNIIGVSDNILRDRAQSAIRVKQKPPVNSWKSRQALDKKIGATKKRSAQFRQWVQDEYAGIVAGRFFETDSGRRKDYTMENLVREMTRTIRDGEGFNYGVGSLRSNVAKQFKSVAEIQRDRGSIISDEAMSKIKDEVGDEMFGLGDEFKHLHGSGEDFGWMDIFTQFLKDLSTGRPRLLDEWQSEIFTQPASEELLGKARTFLQKLTNLPTEYFEVKMGRRVGFDEFAAAVVPDDTPKGVVDALKGHGLKVQTYPRNGDRTDAINRAAGVDGARALFQEREAGGSRGRIDFLADSRKSITLFEGRDLSTLLHEGGHLWLEELRGDALSLQSGKVFADWETTKAWFKREGIEVDDNAPIPTEAHELWARGMERYFMEGKAPSLNLQSAFASFRAWLLRIYKVVANLRAPIEDDVRRVFDRLIATDNAIAWAIHEGDEKALFDTVLPEGMSAEEQRAYRDLVEQSRTEAHDALLYRTMERVRRSRTVKYQEEEARVRASVATEVDARPEFRAIRLIRGIGGEHMPLNRDGVIERVGEAAIAALPRSGPGARTVVEGGVDPDIVAERAGYPDGKTMLESMIGVEQRKRQLAAAGDKRTVQQEAVDIETERRMKARHGDIFDDGSIEEEALELIASDAGSARLAAEVRQLSRMVQQEDAPPAPLQVVRAWAEKTVREARIVDQASGAAVDRHRRAKGKAARAAERAYLDGDMETAYREKQRDMISSELMRASKSAKDEVDVISRRLDRLGRARTLKGMDQEYLERIHELLEEYDLRPRSREDIRERESFDKWAKAQEEAGFEVFIPERLTLAGNRHFTKLTYEELVALDDTVQSLAHLGREKKNLKLAQEERELEELVGEAEMAALGIPLRKISADRNEAKSFARETFASFIKAEFLADKMDDYNPNGVWNRVLIQGATRAANEKEALQQKVLDPLAKLYLDMPHKRKKRLSRRVTVPEFITVDPATKEARATTFAHSEILAIALNVGNQSNLEKMIVGETLALPDGIRDRFGWTEEKVMAVLDRELDQADWEFVTAIWRQIDTLWPDIVRSEREITGVAPEKIEGRTVSTRYGDFEGGYYPVVYDPARSLMAMENEDEAAQKLLGQMGRSVSTPKGHTITRTGAAMPIHFSLERVLFNHVNRVATRVAYGRYVRDALKFIQHPKIRKLVNEHAGPEYYRQLKPWLHRQVSDASMDVNMLTGVDRVLRQFRVNQTLVGLGLRFTTMFAQVGGWNNGAHEIGLKWMGRGMSEMLRNMGSIRNWVFDLSPELAGRAQAFDRDVRTFYQDAGSKLRGKRDGWQHKLLDAAGEVSERMGLDKIRAAAFWGIGMIDVYAVSMPIWVGAYYRAIEAEGMTASEAVDYADKAVRRSQSAGRAKDLAQIQDSSEGYRNLTVFYSYFSVQLNQQFEAMQLARKGDWPRLASNIFWIMVMAPIAGALLTGDAPDVEDGEDPAEAWATWAASRVFFGLWSGVPGVRDLASRLQRKVEGKYTGAIEAPFYRAFTEIERPVEEGIRVAQEGEPSERWVKNTITPIGYFVGLPTGQVANTAQYLLDLSQGDQNPEGTGDLLYGIAKGPQEDQE